MRNYDKEGDEGLANTASIRIPALARYAHAVIFVVKANDPRFADGKYRKTLRMIKGRLRQDGNNFINHSNRLKS